MTRPLNDGMELAPAVAEELGRRLHLVARRVNDAIYRQEMPAALLTPLRRVLRQTGRLFSSPAATGHALAGTAELRMPVARVIVAHALVARVCASRAPMASWRGVAPVAAAVEFFGAATDLAEQSRQGASPLLAQLGPGVALAVTLALLGLAQDALRDPHADEVARAFTAERLARATVAGGGALAVAATVGAEPPALAGAVTALACELGAYLGALPTLGAARATAIASEFARAGGCLGMALALTTQTDAPTPPPARRSRPTAPATDTDLARRASDLQRQAAMTLTRVATLHHLESAWLPWLLVFDER